MTLLTLLNLRVPFSTVFNAEFASDVIFINNCWNMVKITTEHSNYTARITAVFW